MISNEMFLEKARALEPTLNITEAVPPGFERTVLGEGGKTVFDFGTHYVGHIRMELAYEGSHPDAPLWLNIQFAERESELHEDPADYRGWISRGWIQNEQIHIDILPAALKLPRRYAFRYVKIEVLAASSKYSAVIERISCLAESSADDARLRPYRAGDSLLGKMDAVACRTLHECMQKVFEDGPKRDRRLWLGDLRLQALANYESYRCSSLVKRCLYLFAGCADDRGKIPAAVFTEPEIEADDVYMFDYSLLFVPALLDYFNETGDTEALRELWPVAWNQIILARDCFDSKGVVIDDGRPGWCFIDWNLALDKQASAQGVCLYCLKAAKRIAEILGENGKAAEAEKEYAEKKSAALEYLLDKESGFFISGPEKQRSLASQVWMILGGVTEGSEARDLLLRLSSPELLAPVTPYMMHHYVEAAVLCGEKEHALKLLRDYWGEMVNEGADTFWELYNPLDPDESPYGGTIVNSYCHAWSCAPAFFLRKYFN